jgi:hypothetical protein
VVGDLHLPYEAAELRCDQDLSMFAYTNEPHSPTADALGILASWAATREQANDPTEAVERYSHDQSTWCWWQPRWQRTAPNGVVGAARLDFARPRFMGATSGDPGHAELRLAAIAAARRSRSGRRGERPNCQLDSSGKRND